MTYQTNVPNAGQSPGLFPAQANTNFQRLKTIIDANHKFNDTAAGTDGYHELIQMIPVASADVVPDSTIGQLFANSSANGFALTYMDSTGTLYQLTPPNQTLRAAITFGQSGNALGTPYNCSVVQNGSKAQYTVTFSPAIPSANYQFFITSVDPSTNLSIAKITTKTASTLAFNIVNQNNTILSSGTFLNSVCVMAFGG